MSSREPAEPAQRHRGPVLVAVRRGAGALHLVAAAVVVVGVCAQVYLIGGYLFGAGTDALDLHRDVGFSTHLVEVLVLVLALVAWLPRRDLLLALLLAAIGTLQIGLVDASGWTGALHPLLALAVLGLALLAVRRRLPARALRAT